ncbi:MAG TPA: DUF4350 domain-containing protein [Candidatus Dormibacteraeota bacterium]|nr:DUF4350 domain-containing protein [Candidatus Dormibacteraeota bacterium]
MPFSLGPVDRRLLIVFGGIFLMIVAIAAILAPSPVSQFPGFASTYSPASDGSKAAFLLLKDLGYRVERWEEPPTELPHQATSTLLVLAEPFILGSAEEKEALHLFVYRGGRVLAIGAGAAAMVPEGGALDLDQNAAEWKTYHAVLPGPFMRDAPEIAMSPKSRWQMAHANHVPIYLEGADTTVVTYYSGKGQVVWWGAATPLSNSGIKLSGNLNLFLESIGDPANIRVLWDEYYHGRRGTLSSYIAKTPVPWAFLQLGLVAFAVLLTFARRSGPMRPHILDTRQSPLEFVETLGDLYHRGHAGAAAANIAYDHFRSLLTRRLGLPGNESIAHLYQASRDRLGWTQPGFFQALQDAERCTRTSDLSDEDALRVVQSLEHYAVLLNIKRIAPKETCGWRNT